MRVRIKKGETFFRLNINKWSHFKRRENPLREVCIFSLYPQESSHTRRTGGRGVFSPHQQSPPVTTREPPLLLHPRGLGPLSLSPLKLLPQTQMARRRLLLAASIPNESSAPSVTTVSNSPRLSTPRLTPTPGHAARYSLTLCLFPRPERG